MNVRLLITIFTTKMQSKKKIHVNTTPDKFQNVYFAENEQDFAKVGWLIGCRDKANCPHVGPETMGRMPSVGVILRVPSPFLRNFRRNHRKLQTARSTSATVDRTRHPPSSSSSADALSFLWCFTNFGG